jgi:hypothetical protein
VELACKNFDCSLAVEVEGCHSVVL